MLKLSEAIRLGALMKPQHHNRDEFFVVVPAPVKPGDILHLSENQECSCVMGAAIDAAGLEHGDGGPIDAQKGWPRPWRPVLHLQEEPCPECGRRHGCVYDILIRLNDDHRWTRERIADWVAGIEQLLTGTNDGAVCPQGEPQTHVVRA